MFYCSALRQISLDEASGGVIDRGEGEITVSGPLNPPPENLDYDALYEDDQEEDMGSMETHGSVITHLLSQVSMIF